MSSYGPKHCNNCKMTTGGVFSFEQKVLLTVLFLTFIIPGIVCYFLIKPNICWSCGIKK